MTYKLVSMLMLGCIGFGLLALLLNAILSHGSCRAHEGSGARTTLCLFPISVSTAFFTWIIGLGPNNSLFPLWSESVITNESLAGVLTLWVTMAVALDGIALAIICVHGVRLIMSRY